MENTLYFLFGLNAVILHRKNCFDPGSRGCRILSQTWMLTLQWMPHEVFSFSDWPVFRSVRLVLSVKLYGVY